MVHMLQRQQSCAPAACLELVLPGPYGLLRALARDAQYDPSMSDRKARITVTIDPDLAAYAEQLVEAGKAPSVSAVVNDALAAGRLRDQKARRLWKEATERADHEKVARMRAHFEAQLTELPESHRHR
jgi:Arc/MetJ-type ribon-helix-helix transcriptional regulator